MLHEHKTHSDGQSSAEGSLETRLGSAKIDPDQTAVGIKKG